MGYEEEKVFEIDCSSGSEIISSPDATKRTRCCSKDEAGGDTLQEADLARNARNAIKRCGVTMTSSESER